MLLVDPSEPEHLFTFETTEKVRARERVDYWRSIHPAISIDVPNGHRHGDFVGERHSYRAGNGGAVAFTNAGDVEARFEGANPDFLLLSIVLSGEAHFFLEGGNEIMAKPAGGILLLDSGAKIASRSYDCAHAYLTLPKDLFDGEVDPSVLMGPDGACLLPEKGLLRFVRLHLQEIAANGGELSARAAGIAVASALHLASGALGETLLSYGANIEGGALFEAAMAMIRINVASVQLNAASLAQALGCSRASLYRAFSDHETSVGQVIREIRLMRAKTLLAEQTAMPVNMIARMSGYKSAASFTRAFRLQTGITPNEFRAARPEAQF